MIFTKKKSIFDISSFSQGLPKELFEGFAQLVLEDFDKEEKKVDPKKEMLGLIREIKVLGLKERLASVGGLIASLERSGKKPQLSRAKEKFKSLSQELAGFEV